MALLVDIFTNDDPGASFPIKADLVIENGSDNVAIETSDQRPDLI